MSLFFGENFDKFLEIRDTSPGEKFKQLIIAVTWLCDMHKVFPLWQRDALHSSKLSDKHSINYKAIQQLNAVDSHDTHLSLV